MLLLVMLGQVWWVECDKTIVTIAPPQKKKKKKKKKRVKKK